MSHPTAVPARTHPASRYRFRTESFPASYRGHAQAPPENRGTHPAAPIHRRPPDSRVQLPRDPASAATLQAGTLLPVKTAAATLSAAAPRETQRPRAAQHHSPRLYPRPNLAAAHRSRTGLVHALAAAAHFEMRIPYPEEVQHQNLDQNLQTLPEHHSSPPEYRCCTLDALPDP